MKKKILLEFFKFSLFSLCSILVIYLLQKRYETIGCQFKLTESIQGTQICPLYPKSLVGVSNVDINVIPTFDEVKRNTVDLKPGGQFKPESCISRQNLAIIIPYRDRESNLRLLLKYLHPMLQRQQRSYQIIVVEQFGDDVFNKGRIMNIAVLEALKLDPTLNCFIFHDVDLIPESDFNIYECYKQPRHLSPAVDELRYNLMYYNLVGGVLALNLEQLNRTNGFSNLYWGWGAEDDDMSMSLESVKSYSRLTIISKSSRIIDSGYKITRPTNDVGRYKMILHSKRIRAFNRFELLDYWKRYNTDGINSLNKLNYTIKSIKYDHLYTNITVDIGLSVRENLDKAKINHSNFKFY